MSNGMYFLLGLVVGSALTALSMVRYYQRKRSLRADMATDVSEEALARARDLVLRGRIVLAVKTVRDDTGWGLKRAKSVVDKMPRRKDDGFGYYGGPS